MAANDIRDSLWEHEQARKQVRTEVNNYKRVLVQKMLPAQIAIQIADPDVVDGDISNNTRIVFTGIPEDKPYIPVARLDEVTDVIERVDALEEWQVEAKEQIQKLRGDLDGLDAAIKSIGDRTDKLEDFKDWASNEIVGHAGDIEALYIASKVVAGKVADLERLNLDERMAAVEAGLPRISELEDSMVLAMKLINYLSIRLSSVDGLGRAAIDVSAPAYMGAIAWGGEHIEASAAMYSGAVVWGREVLKIEAA